MSSGVEDQTSGGRHVISFDEFDRESFRKRLAKMTDSELIRHGKAANAMFKSASEQHRETPVGVPMAGANDSIRTKIEWEG
jgi:hypothetical protein